MRWVFVGGACFIGGVLLCWAGLIAGLLLPVPAPWRAWAVALLLWLAQH